MAASKLTVPILLNWNDIQAYMEQHDIVEVVRCKDCKHRPYEDAYCNPVFTDDVCPCQCSEDPYYGWNPPADWFCPKGEKGTK